MSREAELVATRIEESVAAKKLLVPMVDRIAAAGRALLASYKDGHKALFFGNGGSAADAQHFAAELAGRYSLNRPAIKALALTVNSSALTAIANDYGFEEVFARQLSAWGDAGDVAVGISTSGTSKNVVAALRMAKARGLITIALTGEGGAALRGEVDHLIDVPTMVTPRIQETHILVGHVWCEIVESGLFPTK
jgi:D-sedoheptulose 7-phosphate isomerase